MIYPIDKLVLSHSSSSTTRSCDRKFEFSHIWGDWEGAREEGFVPETGKAIHAGTQNYLIHRDEVKAHMAMIQAFPYDLEYRDAKNTTRSLEACFATLEMIINSSFINKYDLSYIETKLGIKPAVEVPFAIEIIGSPCPVPVWFVGYIDAILFRTLKSIFEEDDHEVYDIKSTRNWVNDFSPLYEFDEQTVPYGLVLEHILGKKIAQFKTNYIVAYLDLVEPKVVHLPFIKTQEHIQDWFRGLCETIDRISHHMKQGWFPRATNGNVCLAYRKPCRFIQMCSFRDHDTLRRMTGGVPRKDLLHDGAEPWIIVQIPYVKP